MHRLREALLAMRRSRLPIVALVLALTGGCEGLLADGATGPRGSSRTGGVCGSPQSAPSPIGRLTRIEYDHAIEDLLGDTTRPARAFAPDDVTTGFEVGGAVSPLLVEQYLETATSIATRATEDLASLTGCPSDGTVGDEACARTFVERMGRRAYRRPLTSEESASLLELYRTGAGLEDHRTGIQLVLEAMLVSPSFLYHVESAVPGAASDALVELDGFEVASRLSFFFWRSIPDDELLDAAEAGELADPANVEMQARRMLDDERGQRGIRDFHRQWLGLDRLGTLERDPTIYPEYSDALADDMRASLDLFLDEVMHSGSLESLFQADFAYVNERLAPIYGVEGITGTDMQRVLVDPTARSGLLTHPALLTLLGKSNQSDPIHRGVFVRQRLLCQQLPPPPDDVDLTVPDLEPGLTTRERFDQHRDEPRCAGCHQLIDPIGYGFEGYDGIGRFRTSEEGQSIDASGEVLSGGDASGAFEGVVELSDQLVASDAVRACVARQWFRYATGRIESSDDVCTLGELDRRFEESGYDVRELMVALVTTDAFTHRRIPADGSGATAP